MMATARWATARWDMTTTTMATGNDDDDDDDNDKDDDATARGRQSRRYWDGATLKTMAMTTTMATAQGKGVSRDLKKRYS